MPKHVKRRMRQVAALLSCFTILSPGGHPGFLATSMAAETAKPPAHGNIDWHTDVDRAWQTTQRDGRPLLVYVTHRQCVFCRKMEKQTYVDPAVSATVRQDFVPLSLDGESQSPLIKELAITSYPMTFVISPRAVVLDRISGYLAPRQMAQRLSNSVLKKPAAEPARPPAVNPVVKAAAAQAQPVAVKQYSRTARAW